MPNFQRLETEWPWKNLVDMHDNLQYKPRKELVLLCRQFGINTTDLKNEQLVTLLRIKLHQEIEEESRVFGLSGRRAFLNVSDKPGSMAGSLGETETVETSSLEDDNASGEVLHLEDAEHDSEEVAASRSLDEIPTATEDRPGIALSGAGDGSNFVLEDDTATSERPIRLAASKSPDDETPPDVDDNEPLSLAPFLSGEESTSEPFPTDLGHTGVVGESAEEGSSKEERGEEALEEPGPAVSGAVEEDKSTLTDLNAAISETEVLGSAGARGSSFVDPPDLQQPEVQQPAVETSLPLDSVVTTSSQDGDEKQDGSALLSRQGEPETHYGDTTGKGEDAVEAISASAPADDETSPVAIADVPGLGDDDAKAFGSGDEARDFSTWVDKDVAVCFQDCPVESLLFAESGEPPQKMEDSGVLDTPEPVVEVVDSYQKLNGAFSFISSEAAEKAGGASQVSIASVVETLCENDVAGVTGATNITVGTASSTDGPSPQPVAEYAAELNAVNPPISSEVAVKPSGAAEVSQDDPAEDEPSPEATPPSAQESTLVPPSEPSENGDIRQEDLADEQSHVEGAEDSTTLTDDLGSGSVKGTIPEDSGPTADGWSEAFHLGMQEVSRQVSTSGGLPGDEAAATDVDSKNGTCAAAVSVTSESGNEDSPWFVQLGTEGAAGDEASGSTSQWIPTPEVANWGGVAASEPPAGDEGVVATGQHEGTAVSGRYSGRMEAVTAASGPDTTTEHDTAAHAPPASGEPSRELEAVEEGVESPEKRDPEGRPSSKAVATTVETNRMDKELATPDVTSIPSEASTLSTSHDLPAEIIDVEKELGDLDENDWQVSLDESIPTLVAKVATEGSPVGQDDKGGPASAMTVPESTKPVQGLLGYEDRDKTTGWFNSVIQWFAQLCSPSQQG